MNWHCHWNKELPCDAHYCDSCEHQPPADDKPNGRNMPINLEWRREYGMLVPYCPLCDTMSYSIERCVFCGQKFLEG